MTIAISKSQKTTFRHHFTVFLDSILVSDVYTIHVVIVGVYYRFYLGRDVVISGGKCSDCS